MYCLIAVSSGICLVLLNASYDNVVLQVKDLSDLLEDQLGLVNGWLLSTPCKVCWSRLYYL